MVWPSWNAPLSLTQAIPWGAGAERALHKVYIKKLRVWLLVVETIGWPGTLTSMTAAIFSFQHAKPVAVTSRQVLLELLAERRERGTSEAQLELLAHWHEQHLARSEKR